MSTQKLFVLPEGAATGVGSMPGTDAREAARVAVEAVPELPFLPELPARGPGADMIGRTLGMLVELYARVEPSGWRFGDRPGRDTRRARAWLGEDLDALEEFTQGYSGPLKVQAVGPWTLAAAVELRGGEAALSDPGACRDLAASLAEGLRAHLADLRRRVPGARPVLQLDEPSLTAVLRGQVRTASGYRTHRAVDRAVIEGALRDLIATVGAPAGGGTRDARDAQDARSTRDPRGPQDGPGGESGGSGGPGSGPGGESGGSGSGGAAQAATPVLVHSCAPGVPFALLRAAGAAGVSFDAALLTERDDDAFGEAAEAGTALLAGVVPGKDAPLSDPASSVGGVRALWRRLGLAPGALGSAVAVTPSCGLAGASPAYARAALAHCAKAARTLVDNPE